MLSFRVRWPVVILASTMLSACGRHADVDLALTVGEGAKSLFLGIEVDETVEVRAIDLSRGEVVEFPVLDAYVGRYAVTLTAIEHVADLETLRLTPGLLEDIEGGTPIPTGAGRIMGTTIRGDAADPWTPRDTLGPALASYRIDGPRRSECLDRGGCFDSNAEDPKVCVVPCPAPSDPPDAPAEVMPPQMTCPASWTASDLGGGTSVCTPFPTGPTDCPNLLMARFPGEAACRAPGVPCPTGDWPEGLGGTVIYVRPGATNGDGTMGTPYGTVAEAQTAATAGTTIALSKGTHAGTIELPDDVAIVGACVEQTQLDGTGSAASTVRVSSGRKGTIRNLFIRARGTGVAVTGAGSSATLEGVVIREGRGNASIDVASGAQVQGHDVFLGESETRGIRVSSGGRLELDRLVVDRASRIGIFVGSANSLATLRDVSITNMQPDRTSDEFGRAIDIESGGAIVAERMYVGRARDLAVYVNHAGSSFSVVDGVIEDTLPRVSDDGQGDALHILGGSRLDLSRVWIDGSKSDHIFMVGTNSANTTTASIADAVFTTADQQVGGGDGFGIRVFDAARLTLERAVIEETYSTALYVEDADSLLDLVDVRVKDVGTLRSSGSATALRAEQSGRITATRLAFENLTGKAIHVEGPIASADVSDVSVSHAGFGSCLVCSGLCAHGGGKLVGERVRVEGAFGRGLNASDADSLVDVEHVAVRQSSPAPVCTSGPRQLPGDGVGVIDGGRLEISWFLIEQNPGGGVVVENYIGIPAEGEGVYATDGVVRDNAIGANVFIADYPVEAVANRVLYVDNASNLNN